MRINKILALGVSACMLLSFAACGSAKDVEVVEAENVGIANPWVEYQSLDEAASAAGFSFEVPEEITGYSEKNVSVMENSLIQVSYINGDDSVVMRKGIGDEDISGDYNEYAEVNTVSVGEYTVTESGSDGLVYLATWTTGDYSYSVSVDGMSADDLASLIAIIK